MIKILDYTSFVIAVLFAISLFTNIISYSVYKTICTNEVGEVPFKVYNREAKVFVINGICTVILFILLLVGTFVSINIGEYKIDKFLEKCTPENTIVFVANDRWQDVESMTDMIRGVRSSDHHKSTETVCIPVIIVNNKDTSFFNFCRDSDYKNQYWVYYINGETSNLLGQIFTSKLAKFTVTMNKK